LFLFGHVVPEHDLSTALHAHPSTPTVVPILCIIFLVSYLFTCCLFLLAQDRFFYLSTH
jgi:hypothetical protein